MAALEYWLWLSAAELSPRSRWAVIEHFGDAEAAFLSPDGALAALPVLGRQEAEKLEKRDLTRARQVLAACARQELRPVSYADPEYPARLRNIPAPPAVLYVKGHLPAIDENAPIAVIGTRKATPYGLKMARELSWQIASCGGIVISLPGSAIDTASVKAALQAGGTVVGVLGTAHEQERSERFDAICQAGALVSEYAPGTIGQKHFFRERNRIAAGLSVGVVVVEAPEKSGTRLFADEAAEQGKEIFAVPGNADAGSSAGTLELLKEGARLATCGWDVMSEFAPLYPERIRLSQKPTAPEIEETPREPAKPLPPRAEKQPPPKPENLRKQLEGLNPEQLSIVTALSGETLHIDDLIEKTGLSTATVLAQMTMLEIRGYVRREPGRRYSLNLRRK